MHFKENTCQTTAGQNLQRDFSKTQSIKSDSAHAASQHAAKRYMQITAQLRIFPVVIIFCKACYEQRLVRRNTSFYAASWPTFRSKHTKRLICHAFPAVNDGNSAPCFFCNYLRKMKKVSASQNKRVASVFCKKIN